MHKLHVLRDFPVRFLRSTRVVVPQNLSSSALLLVTFNSHAYTHTCIHRICTYMCVCIFIQQPKCRRRLYSDTFFFISFYFFYFCLTSTLRCKRYIFLLFCACRELPLDRCSVFCLFFYVIFSLTLLSIGFRCAASLSLCCCRGQNPSNGFCDRFRTVAAGALCSVQCSAAPCCCKRTSATSLLLLLLSVSLDGWMDAHICI